MDRSRRPTPPLRTLIVDPFEPARAGIRTLLEPDRLFRCVAESGTLKGAVDLVVRRRIDLAILETHFPNGNPFLTCQWLVERVPHLIVLFVSAQWDSHSTDRATNVGGRGCFDKGLPGRRLMKAIRRAAEASLCDLQPRPLPHAPVAADPPIERLLPALSPRQLQLLPLISQGRTNREIAEALSLKEHTVQNYLFHVYRKLHIARRAKLSAIYVRETGTSEALPITRCRPLSRSVEQRVSGFYRG